MQQGTSFWNDAAVTQPIEDNGKATSVVIEFGYRAAMRMSSQ